MYCRLNTFRYGLNFYLYNSLCVTCITYSNINLMEFIFNFKLFVIKYIGCRDLLGLGRLEDSDFISHFKLLTMCLTLCNIKIYVKFNWNWQLQISSTSEMLQSIFITFPHQHCLLHIFTCYWIFSFGVSSLQLSRKKLST